MTGYAWVEALEAYCFTAIIGLHPDEAIRRLGGDPHACQPRTFDECFWAADGPQWVQVDNLDGRVLVAEHNGWRAEEAAEALSASARLACFYRNVQAVMHFVYAIDGTVVAEFDPLLDNGPPARAHPSALDVALEGLPFGLFGAESSALTLLERLTGVRVTRSWLDAKRRAVALPPLR